MNSVESNKCIHFDYVIFGSGAVGSTIANDLSENNSVALVDIAKIEKNIQGRRTRPPFLKTCSNIYTPAFSNVFGGNTELWNSKIYLLSEKEVESWPIEYDELIFYSNQCSKDFGLDHDDICNINYINSFSFLHRSRRWLKQNENSYDVIFSDSKMNLFHFYKILDNKNIVCFEKSSIFDFKLSKDNKVINKVTIFNGKNFININVKKSVILCAGGLGNLPLIYKFTERIIEEKPHKRTYKLADHPHYEVGRIYLEKPNLLLKSYLKSNIKNKKGIEDCNVIFGKSNNYAFQLESLKLMTSPFLRLYKRSTNFLLQDLYLILNKVFSKFHGLIKLILLGKKSKSNYSLALFF
tara:strand:- start:4725 stop:5780 length:1056 start_codon:yes stop_codon:yes gene_type:complete